VRRGRHDRQSSICADIWMSRRCRSTRSSRRRAQRKGSLVTGAQRASEHRESARLRLDGDAGERLCGTSRPAASSGDAPFRAAFPRIVALDADDRRLDTVDETQRPRKIRDLGMREVSARDDRHALVVMIGNVSYERVHDDIIAGNLDIADHAARQHDRVTATGAVTRR